jgi:ubiquinone/menaquinone biosynthesis C-methylase UbiE
MGTKLKFFIKALNFSPDSVGKDNPLNTPKGLSKLAEEWEALANQDPFWAILAFPDKKENKWNVGEFFQGGEIDLQKYLDDLKVHKIEVEFKGKALDFGCGVGRITQALGHRFAAAIGIDISPRMIELAKTYNQDEEKCKYLVHQQETLSIFPDNEFDFIISVLVLQHMEERYALNYIAEFMRILKPGGILYFQIPTKKIIQDDLKKNRKRNSLYLRLKSIIQALCPFLRKERIAHWLEILKLKKTDSQKLIKMYYISEKTIRETIGRQGGKTVATISNESCGDAFESKSFIVTK